VADNRIELTVTRPPEEADTRHPHFQYPLSDRTHCNLMLPATYCARRWTFSILYRIELTVTDTIEPNRYEAIISFSILYRIELTVTTCVNRAPRCTTRLSVSSIGSNSL